MAYTLKEVSKKMNVTPGMIRQWEKDLAEVISIPRSKQGARIFTDFEIGQLREIKAMYSNKLGKDVIRQLLQRKSPPLHGNTANLTDITEEPMEASETPHFAHELSLKVVSEPIPELTVAEEKTANVNQFFEALDGYTKNFLDEIKEEIRTIVRKEILEDVKKEIKNGTFYTVKSLSDSVYKSTANTKAEMEELSETIEEAAKLTADRLKYLSDSIKNVSINTNEDISILSKQITETTDDLVNYMDSTNEEISLLAETISKERDVFIEESEQYRHEIRQREIAFQQLLANFREVAATKEKKWWKFWN